MYELVGRHWSSLKPYKFKGTKEQITEKISKGDKLLKKLFQVHEDPRFDLSTKAGIK